MKLIAIRKMLENNFQMQEYINKNKNELTRSQLVDLFNSKFMQHDTILNVYFDFVEYLSPENFCDYEKFRDLKYENIEKQLNKLKASRGGK